MRRHANLKFIIQSLNVASRTWTGIKVTKTSLVIYISISWNLYETVWATITHETFRYDALWNWPFINGIPLNFMMNCFISFPFRNAPCPILGVKSLGLGKYDFSAFVLCIINWAGNLYKTRTSLEDWSDISYILAHIKWETRLTWQGNAIFVWQFQASRSRETTRSTLDGSLKSRISYSFGMTCRPQRNGLLSCFKIFPTISKNDRTLCLITWSSIL